MRSKKENYNVKVVVFWLYLSGKSNRYGYCVNNPLKYTDISGNDFGISAAIVIAVSVALTSYLAVNFLTDQPITFEGAATAVVMGAISGAVTFGIGEAFLGTGNIYLRAAYSALAHGTFQGGMTAIQGGNFWNGFAAGSLSSIAGSVVGRIGGKVGKFLNTRVGSDLFAMAAGGTGASLTGGNFWQGAVTGLIVNELNHLGHQEDPPKKNYKKFFKEKLNQIQTENGDGYITYEEAHYTYMLGKGQVHLNAKLSKMDLSKVSASDFPGGIGSRISVNFASNKFYTNFDQALVYGNITLELLDINTVFVPFQDKYDFDLRLTPGNFKRDFLTMMGAQLQGGGTPFWITISGTAKIKP